MRSQFQFMPPKTRQPPNSVRKVPPATALDRTDHAIVAELQHNARLSNKELAARVGLSPSSCLARVRRLQGAGVLRGFHAEVEPAALGLTLQALVSVQLRRHAREAFASFRAHLLSLPAVVAVYQLSGSHDFLVHVAVRDTQHLSDLLDVGFAEHPDLGHMSTALVFECVRTPARPADPPPAPEPPRPRPRRRG